MSEFLYMLRYGWDSFLAPLLAILIYVGIVVGMIFGLLQILPTIPQPISLDSNAWVAVKKNGVVVEYISKSYQAGTQENK